MAELFRTRCTEGMLVITDAEIRIELGKDGSIKQQTMFRDSLTDVASSLGVISVFGLGGGTNLAFKSQSGEVLHAHLVKPSIAKEILSVVRKRT